MTMQEILSEAQILSIEQRKQLIANLLAMSARAKKPYNPLPDSVIVTSDIDEAIRNQREQIKQLLLSRAAKYRDNDPE